MKTITQKFSSFYFPNLGIENVLFPNKTENPLSLHFLKTFSPAKQHASSLSTCTIQNPNAGPNREANSPTKTQLYPIIFGKSTKPLHHHAKSSDVILSNKMITSHIRCGDLDSALNVFDNMTVKTTVTWNSVLAGLSKKRGKLKEAQELFVKIPEPDAVSYNTMLSCYVRNSNMERAQAFFEDMPIKDTPSWNTMITGFAQNQQMDKARDLFLIMPTKNVVTWNAMISGYVECGDLDSALKLFEKAPFKSVVSWTAMITGYMKLGRIGLAERLFQNMPEKNLVTWNAMIAGYIENHRAEDGVKLFRTMVGFGIQPNSSTFSSALLGCSDLSALQLGRQVHQLVCKSPLCDDTTAGTSLISMYCKCGVLEDGWKLFVQVPRRDVVTWNAMISGYAQHGEGKKALGLFDEMIGKGMKPDWITFVAVLMACNHAGFTDLGVKYFHSMAKDYGLVAKPDHYTCMVDLLGRAGKLVEAVDLIEKMPFKPHAAVFGTLLGACRIHKNTEMAEFASQKLLNLDPASATGYVQLANVYAATKRWDHVARVRKSMKSCKVVKTPGYSWIEVKSRAHQFRSGDKFHPELASIHEKLKELEKKMKLAGYVPDLEFALHDVGEEQKEQLLWWHSEKLAIAYGLIKLPPGTPIRVFKNLRVCGDCHRATKLENSLVEVFDPLAAVGRVWVPMKDRFYRRGNNRQTFDFYLIITAWSSRHLSRELRFLKPFSPLFGTYGALNIKAGVKSSRTNLSLIWWQMQELQEVFKNCDIHEGYRYITLLQIYGRMIVQCGGEMATGRGHRIIQTGRKTFLMTVSHQSRVSGSKSTPDSKHQFGLLYEHSKGTAKVLFPSRCQMGKAGGVAEKRIFLAALRKI
uniref:Pentatricopeptide repeat-containing protein n=1 Tax=Populus alba TaxID=43335 RepID=A0A4U5PY68_POPAL|nr:pentatricopeptide repeat-containing protein [Populus alba]